MATKKQNVLDTKPASPSTSELRALFNGRVIAPDDLATNPHGQFSTAALTVVHRQVLIMEFRA